MESLKNWSGPLTVANSAGLVIAIYYFHKEDAQRQSEIEALRRQVAELQAKVGKNAENVRKEFKHLRKEMAASQDAGQVEDMSVTPREASARSGRPPATHANGRTQRQEECSSGLACKRPAPAVRSPTAKLSVPASRNGAGAQRGSPAPKPAAGQREARPAPPPDEDFDALSESL